MLKFKVAVEDIRDIGDSWRFGSDRWTAGSSWFEPFQSPALEHSILTNPSRTVVIVRERITGRGALDGSATVTTLAEINAALKEVESWPGDFVVVDMGHSDVRIACGSWGSAPLYLSGEGTSLRASWDFLDLRNRLSAAYLDDETMVRLLSLQPRYSMRTICGRILRLTERACASWGPGSDVRIAVPQPAVHYRPRELKDDAAVLPAYGELLRHAVSGRSILGEDVVLELSGGTDSATVAVAARDVWADAALASYGLLISGPASGQQVMRRKELSRLARLSDVTVDAASHLPLAPVSTDTEAAPFEEPYREALAAALAAAPHPIVLTGIGGDELFALRPYEQQPSDDGEARRMEVPAWALLSESAHALARELAVEPDELPPSMVPESALMSLHVRAPVFLRRGRWPVSPLCDPELIRFGEWLPRRWRDGKRLPREWLLARGAPRNVAWPRLRENFAPVMQTALHGHGMTQLERMATEGSALVDLGYVDGNAIRRLLMNAGSGGDLDPSIYDTLALERELSRLL
jgi:asparagine synthase (glutamine-hydrolysing)